MNNSNTKVYRPSILPFILGGIPLLLLLSSGYFNNGDSTGFFTNIIFYGFFFGIAIASLMFQKYELKEEGVLIKSGIIAKSRGMILYSQIQDVRVYQGLVQRIFGFKNIEVKTMSANSGIMTNLRKADTEEIRQFLMAKKNSEAVPQIGKKAVTDFQEEAIPYLLHPFRKFFAVIAFLVLLEITVFSVFFSFFIKEYAFLFVAVLISLLIFCAYFIIVLIIKYALAYSLKKDFFYKKIQFLSISEITIFYDKIQDIIISQDIIDRIIGQASICLETGEDRLFSNSQGSSGYISGKIPYLKIEDAFALQDKILKRSLVKNAVTSDLRAKFPLIKKSVYNRAIKSTFTIVIIVSLISTIAFLLVKNFGTILTLAFIIVFVFFAIILVYQHFFFKSYSYSDNNELLMLRRGVFFQKTLLIPYSKIQNIFVDKDMFDAMFGLWDVHVSSAGTTQMQLHIDGVNTETASRLRNYFLMRTIRKK